jgi:Fe-S cluster assembly protein SufD
MPNMPARRRKIMNAEVRAIKTAAEQALSAAYADARSTLPGDAAISALRADAFRVFEAAGLPHRRVEQWKYTDLRTLMRDAKPLADAGKLEAAALAKLASILSGVDASLLTVVNARHVCHGYRCRRSIQVSRQLAGL